MTSDQELIRQTAREFVDKHVRPVASECDREKRWPEENIKRMAEQGFLGMNVDPQHGGAGADMVSYAIVIEEL